ncbi:MAG: threonylcarbamoyl-AMP synthase [Rhizobiales bacterium 24-66-13]|jgi:L-threonylcarbamoyladenylate synthase|uniref:L-threonylcarbamoyladenylate synthase n=1 Tax=Roseixanthobacter finlandensis TaxID=3119922 RepID=UPI000BD0724B|nr:MAG: threonylcarbamoyl-AMP synthase [Rhizobiales bacterium 24-66-13]OZB04598.1 MAG: threonylcarbamoyl-AMP synthase [Rhizobiales bacterium 39-66-18]HQS07200.1 L-threonylcarbamoyladenylate synthase [Xanthobacteraceae bacterium]HQS45670.1 L-threonylcarbamoyladenylate synthase [Xanthobacteraceae bacterium]
MIVTQPAPKSTHLLDATGSGEAAGAGEAVAEAARLLRAGGVVAFPTETVYGLGADAGNAQAVAQVYAAKGRPAFNPLISHVPDGAAAERLGVFSPAAQALAAAFWPGPLTLVVPYRDTGAVCDLARAGLSTIALRVPAHAATLAMLRAAGVPVVGPSANRSGHVSPTDAAHVRADLDGRIDAILDAGPTTVGVESTIVDCTGAHPALLRPGGLSRGAIAAVLGVALPDAAGDDSDRPSAPGRLASHYAPHAPVRLDARAVKPGEALLTFAGLRPPGTESAVAVFDLSPSGDLVEAAARLYGALRHLDSLRVQGIAVVPLPRDGLGEAIADRLGRAAAPRPLSFEDD